jgi:hypothetical protein
VRTRHDVRPAPASRVGACRDNGAHLRDSLCEGARLGYIAGEVVFLAGGARTDPRWAPMTDWASTQLRRRLTTPDLPRDPGSLVVPWRPKVTKRPGNAATMAVIEVLRAAGIHGDPSVRPTSVTAWAGRRLLLRGVRIEEVARALGCRSLDRTAHLIGLDWRNPPEDGRV